jgi:hypothetical protein
MIKRRGLVHVIDGGTAEKLGESASNCGFGGRLKLARTGTSKIRESSIFRFWKKTIVENLYEA